MRGSKRSLAIAAAEVPPRTKPSNYPEPFFSRMARREKRPLGDFFGLENFGVNLTTIEPGGETALMHSHSKQDEMIYIVQGNPHARHRIRRDNAHARNVRGFPCGKRGASCGQPF